MTLDEAIIHAEKVMMNNLEKTKDRNASDPIAIKCFECADEHRQLAEWLKEYKRLLGAIDDIMAEINDKYMSDNGEMDMVPRHILSIIDKHTSGKENS